MSNTMTHRDRAACVLNCGIPDRIPTFELEYQLAPLMFGHDFLYSHELNVFPRRRSTIRSKKTPTLWSRSTTSWNIPSFLWPL